MRPQTQHPARGTAQVSRAGYPATSPTSVASSDNDAATLKPDARTEPIAGAMLVVSLIFGLLAGIGLKNQIVAIWTICGAIIVADFACFFFLHRIANFFYRKLAPKQ